MKKITLFITLILITSISYFLYNKYGTDQNKKIWDFVPANALLVYETQSAFETYNSFRQTQLREDITKPSLSGEIDQAFSSSDTSKYVYKLIKQFQDQQILISIHSITKEDLDFIYFIDISKNNKNLAQKHLNQLIKTTNAEVTIRTYNHHSIFEINADVFQFSYLIEDDILTISQTPFLIEDVIRTISSPKKSSYDVYHPKAIKANKLKNDQGDLYINTSTINTLIKSFTSELDIIKFAHSTFMDVKVRHDLISLSGFTYPRNNDFLNSMKGQNPVKISINSYIPNTAYSVLHTGISDVGLWYDGYQNKTALGDSLWQWNTKRMTQWIGEELALINLNTQHFQGKLIFIDTKDVKDALSQINILAEDISKQLEDIVFYENYADILITELNILEFPKKLFGEVYHGFDITYYAIIDDYLVFANNIESMHILINSIEQEDTWGRTLSKNRWLSHTLEEANLTYFFDFNQGIEPLKNLLHDRWKNKLTSNKKINGFGMGAVQFSNIDGQFYTNMLLQYDLDKKNPASLIFDTESTIYLEHNIITKPFVVSNHNLPRVREVLVQDSLKNIYLIDHQDSIAWKKSIGQSISGKIYQIDFYKNKKLQYLFAAGQFIYLIDRNGNEVEGFTIDTGFEIKQLSVIDYDNAKNYRILVADKNGNLYMYDKNGNNLEGWSPKKMDEALVNTPRHIRVRGKDMIVTTHIDGNIHVSNRKGETLKGFPIALKNGISGDIHIEFGRNFNTTILSAISNEGELIQFDLNAELLNKKQFYKPTKDSFFELVDGVMKNDFIIVRQSNAIVSLLTVDGETIIEKDYLSNGQRNLKYYDFGGDYNLFVVNDFIQKFGYVYNQQGKLLSNVPINTDFEIGLLKNTEKKKTYIYSVYKNEVNVYSY